MGGWVTYVEDVMFVLIQLGGTTSFGEFTILGSRGSNGGALADGSGYVTVKGGSEKGN